MPRLICLRWVHTHFVSFVVSRPKSVNVKANINHKIFPWHFVDIGYHLCPHSVFLKHLELRNIYLYGGVNKAYKINLVPSAYESGSLIRDFIRSKTFMQTEMTDKTVRMRYVHMHFSLDQNQDQDSLLVKRRNDNHSPGPVIRELVPSSHQRSELSYTILCIFSGWDQRIGEGIPIPDSVGEEATFINICIGNGSLKCHRVLIPTTPSFGDKVIYWYTGFTVKTFI